MYYPVFPPEHMLSPTFYQLPSIQLKAYISSNYCIEENSYLESLLAFMDPAPSDLKTVALQASLLIEKVRAHKDGVYLLDQLLLEYSLDTQEGILLMCLSETLLRVPDPDTADALIADKLGMADWHKHLKSSDSFLVNAASWGLMLTGKVVNIDPDIEASPVSMFDKLMTRLGETITRNVLNKIMTVMGGHFVLGRDIDEAFENGETKLQQGYSYSFDMLGEAAVTAEDAQSYFQSYRQAIISAGQHNQTQNFQQSASVSIKLSALHPRFEESQRHRVMTELYQTVLVLIREAKHAKVAITIDAEEMDRFELYLDLFEQLYQSKEVQSWGELGVVIQAYSKRALPTLLWLSSLAREQKDIIPVRLVKGAYWDSEIKQAQQLGLDDYPVYTRKDATDLSYLACAKFLLNDVARYLFPQFATHNAHTVAAIQTLALNENVAANRYEFQRLHGMGIALYDVVRTLNPEVNVRIYAPIGAHADLLPYLVRRLLENGANSSFVHRIVDANTPISELVIHPITALRQKTQLRDERIPLPCHIFGSARQNSAGINLHSRSHYLPLYEQIDAYMTQSWQGASIIQGELVLQGEKKIIADPCNQNRISGECFYAKEEDVVSAIHLAHSAFYRWHNTALSERAAYLNKMADLLETNRVELIALCHREAGKTLEDSIDEVREAVDFCRYYASQARAHFMKEKTLPGPTGELNQLYYSGRGVFACISPWNFPLAIFTGQIAAALVTGNTVLAKPASQTGLMATRVTQLWHEAGIPTDVLHLLVGEGRLIGNAITQHTLIAGVAFTGSTETAQTINRNLAARAAPIAPLIAETGGQNAMIVDSTALPEHVVKDVIRSAFSSAGQRCSALRVLYLQEDIADKVIRLLKGAMAELSMGDPSRYETDIGPVIDVDSQQKLQAHIHKMHEEGTLIYETQLSKALAEEAKEGVFVAPVAFKIHTLAQLEQEHFGPILHVITYPADGLPKVIEEINQSAYGLTLCIHTRNEHTAKEIDRQVHVGNVYINRNQIGATVGVQPFGGQGLSGTGPKAGGPGYLFRFSTERTRTTNTSAVGGDTALLSLGAQ